MSVSIVANIKKIALEKNLTIKQIGKESGVGENAIYRWDKQNPNLSSLKKVSNYLNISIDELLEREKQEV
ncbi:helix-turn-helix transcriptional regulator [Enterococcus faecalis]|uniref:helix-turn-helix domain-containing protein n=1 Tax=Enterococcus TaxID=1350 RepID=UPI000CF25633|nr:helix-turn-helix transcriptional regulator [Enterococcus faecalis]EGO2600259.1 helix-turn-helix transcriptional regulator [Enterococcus faecalis]EGO2808288.1 helix-turn-helix transcriptional regulator [Enterococcus faecalis]EGO6046535.1 helix-turn-helix transcriptional regulator [Enterococcus faecalis]EGO8256949.1 helix-turn-helix transcriptional regulator [Enterococcus faecalis]EGO8469468.1 XRE family transcriptional regulator [Enterococcus faecalis]